MENVTIRMACPVCGHRWSLTVCAQGEVVDLVDDLCPACQSQGEPEAVEENSHHCVSERRRIASR